ncbi:MAG: hypothetical protein K6T51_02870 [Rubrobacteraceae bacterium]|uniref:hypothetical protein n=1 Tax=Rubrobacter naiadicus TaxID=1392641 RepID=UPI002360FF1C|nr:hypothetical protein [Rubrobacter naiadicus]MBX6762365.1 hypothetical protein [Rubrobacteraceae bacterium]MCL6437528.1 hypothetical protein [Rubrobacteraceae bacterium]
MLREGDRVVVVYREDAPLTWRYAGREGRVVRVIPTTLHEEAFYVEIDGNTSIHTAFREREVQPAEELRTASRLGA